MKILRASERRKLLCRIRSKKEMRIRRKRKKAKKKSLSFNIENIYGTSSNTSKANRNTFSINHHIHAPHSMDLLDNCDDTILCFSEVIRVLTDKSFSKSVNFDFSQTTKIQPSAALFLIAVIRNFKRYNRYHLKISKSKQLTKFKSPLTDQDFLNFIFVDRAKREYISDFIQVYFGNNADTSIAKKICDFVIKTCNSTLNSTKQLYATLVELMENAKHHAYSSKKSSLIPNWYIYVEFKDSDFSFVFLDTGISIPATVKKNFGEKIINVLNLNDPQLISSALRGLDNRSRTGLHFRNRGLPHIYENCRLNNIVDFKVLSGKGSCFIDKAGHIEERSLKYYLNGTVMSWKMMLGG